MKLNLGKIRDQEDINPTRLNRIIADLETALLRVPDTKEQDTIYLTKDNEISGDNDFTGDSTFTGDVIVNGSLTTNDPVINNDTVENNSTVQNDGVVTNNERMVSNMEVVNKFAANIASAATINLTASEGNYAHVTGTVTITAVTLETGKWFEVIFDGALTLTHHATNCNLNNGGSNITTAAGDRCKFFSDGTTVYGILRKASGEPVNGGVVLVAPTRQKFTSGTPTWTRPVGCVSINVRVVGGGGSGASVASNFGGGGGGGGYSEKRIDVTAISSVTVTVGAAGNLSKFDTHCTGGAGGNASGYAPGAGGVGSGGDINSEGQGGQGGSSGMGVGGQGGSSVLGGGGRSASTGNLYGGGGGGRFTSGTNAGAAGIVIVDEYYNG